MGQSLTHLLVQAIFSTKGRRPFLRSEEIRNEIHAYIKASHWVGRPFRARRLISLPRAILLDRSAVIANVQTPEECACNARMRGFLANGLLPAFSLVALGLSPIAFES